MGTHPDTSPFRILNRIPRRRMLYALDSPDTPLAEARETLMGFPVGDTTALDLSELQRVQLLGQCTDLNTKIKNTIRTIL